MRAHTHTHTHEHTHTHTHRHTHAHTYPMGFALAQWVDHYLTSDIGVFIDLTL